MIFHSGIFYPEEKEELLSLVTPIKDGEKHKAFILPHMALKYCAHLYREVFASISDGTRIIALLPLHREPLLKDEGKILFSPQERTESTPLGDVRIGSLGYTDSASYEAEEYSLELLYPFTAFHNPSSVLYPLFSAAESSQDVKKLTALLSSLDDGNTAFIVSSNMTGKVKNAEEVSSGREMMTELLAKKEPLLDLWRKGRITPCGAPLIESVSRITASAWTLIGISEKETMAGHAAFYGD